MARPPSDIIVDETAVMVCTLIPARRAEPVPVLQGGGGPEAACEEASEQASSQAGQAAQRDVQEAAAPHSASPASPDNAAPADSPADASMITSPPSTAPVAAVSHAVPDSDDISQESVINTGADEHHDKPASTSAPAAITTEPAANKQVGRCSMPLKCCCAVWYVSSCCWQSAGLSGTSHAERCCRCFHACLLQQWSVPCIALQHITQHQACLAYLGQHIPSMHVCHRCVFTALLPMKPQ